MTGLFNWLGSANVQKMIGIIGGPSVATWDTSLPMWTRGVFAVAGPTFAALVHAVDAWRANINTKPVVAAASNGKN